MPLFPKAKFEIVADDKSKKGVDSAHGNLARLRKQISLTGVASVAAAGIAGIGALTVAGLRLGDEMAETADKLGLTTEGLASLRHAARLTGVETNKLDLGLQRMTRRIAEAAQGTGEAQGALKELGLDAERLSQLSPDEQFREIAEAMKGVTSQSDRVRLGFKLFDSEGVDLIRTLDLGADGLDRAAQEAAKFGTAISRVRAREIEAAGEGIDRVRTAAEGLSIQLAASFAPAITDASNILAGWISSITNTALPAFKLMAERIGLVALNVRALSEQELLVRTVVLEDTIAALREEISNLGSSGPFGADVTSFAAILIGQLVKAKQQLKDVNARIAELRAGPEVTLSAIVVGGQSDALADLEKRLSVLRISKIEVGGQEGAFADLEKRLAVLRERDEARIAGAAELDRVREFLKSREQIEIEAFERRNQIILDNMAEGEAREALLLENARNRAEALIEIERAKQEEINRAVLDGIATREQFEKASLKTQVKGVLGTLESITAGVATHSKTMFNLNKAAAIANAVINTAEGVTKALSAYPPPLSFAMAAAQAAAGAAQIAAIRSATFGGGSTPSVVGSTPTLEGQPVPPSGPAPGGARGGSGTVVEVHFHGSGFLVTDDLNRVLKERFDADEVIIHPSSRQAQAIRGGG